MLETMPKEEFNKYKRELRKKKNLSDEEIQQIRVDYCELMDFRQSAKISKILDTVICGRISFDELLNELKNVKSYVDYIKLMDKTEFDSNEAFVAFGNLIPIEYYSEVFKGVYCSETEIQKYINNPRSKYFKEANTMLDKVQRLEKDNISNLEIVREKLDEDGFIIVYRGLNDFNDKRLKGNSWTISQDIGEYFASARLYKVGSIGQVYQGKVHIDDIIAYIDDRDEFEVVVRYENVKDLKMIREMKSSDYVNKNNE